MPFLVKKKRNALIIICTPTSIKETCLPKEYYLFSKQAFIHIQKCKEQKLSQICVFIN